jgi:hypothetical protein
MRFLVAIFASVIFFALAGAAGAHNRGSWYWSPALAQSQLIDDGIEWEEGYEYVEAARCRGWGKWIISTRTGRKLYKHFRCSVQTVIEDTGESDAYSMNFHVTGRYSWEAYP